MTKKKTPRKSAATKKTAPKKKQVSSKSKPAQTRAGSRKKTSSSNAPKTKKTTSVKKSSSSKSTANANKTGARSSAAKKTAAAGKKPGAGKKKAAATKKKPATAKKKAARKAAATKGKAPASAKKTASKQTNTKVTGSAGKPKSPKEKKPAGEKSTASRGLASKSRPIAFSLDEARHIARTRASDSVRSVSAPKKQSSDTPASPAKKGEKPQEPKPAARVLGAASLAEILGRTPGTSTSPVESLKKEVPKKLHRYLELLQGLREHVLSELDLHTKDTLKRSSKEDSGNLSGYGQHMADAGTVSFDRDFALSLVSTEQEALSEIEAAIERIHKGTYGVCEITGKPISKERLLAVPFARYSIEGQVEYEKTKRHPSQRGGAYLDSGSDGGDFLTDDSEE